MDLLIVGDLLVSLQGEGGREGGGGASSLPCSSLSPRFAGKLISSGPRMQVREVRREAGNRKQVVAVKWTVRGPLNTSSPDWQGRGGGNK